MHLNTIPQEYLRPWKLVTLAMGLALLIAGSFYCQAPDWDIPISFIMAFFTCLTAPWSLGVILHRRWQYLPMMLWFTRFSVDGCDLICWHINNPDALVLMRAANFPASLFLYGMCGLVWYFPGILKEFARTAKETF